MLEDLTKAIDEYVADNSEENKRSLTFYLIMTTTRFSTEEKSIEESLNDLDKAKKINDMIDFKGN
jgi:hypothetical protein